MDRIEEVKKILETLCASGGCITCGLDDYQCPRLHSAIKQICQLRDTECQRRVERILNQMALE